MPALIFNQINEQPSTTRCTLFQVIADGVPMGILRDEIKGGHQDHTPRLWIWHPYHKDSAICLEGLMTLDQAKAHLGKEMFDTLPFDLISELHSFRVYGLTKYGFRYELQLQWVDYAGADDFQSVFGVGGHAILNRDDVMDEAMDAMRQPLPDSHVPGDWITTIKAVNVLSGHTHELMTSTVKGVNFWTTLRESAAPERKSYSRVA